MLGLRDSRLQVSLVTLLAFMLRIYQIGKDSFWLDETGVASVIFVNSFDEFIFLVRSHVASVPLDYVITWFIGQFTLNEGWLRLPSAIWGTLTLIVSYDLFCKLTDKRNALIGILLLALSPLLVKYSQELRFYSSLIFFYLLSTNLFLVALKSSRARDWTIFTLATIIGGYFHIFVPFSLVNGVLWLAFSGNKRNKSSIRSFTVSMIFILLGTLSAYYFFAGYNSRVAEPLSKYESLPNALGTGLGWLPITSSGAWTVYMWGAFCFILEAYGLIYLLHKKAHAPVSILLYSTIVQAGIVLSLAVIRGYFIVARHFIFLLPVFLLIGAIGFNALVEKISMKALANCKFPAQIVRSFGVGLLCIASLAALIPYYQGNKGMARETAIFLSQEWEEGEFIFFFPQPYSAVPYKYYLVEVMGHENMLPYMWHADIDTNIDTIINWSNERLFLIGSATPEQASRLSMNGFIAMDLQEVWIRPAQ